MKGDDDREHNSSPRGHPEDRRNWITLAGGLAGSGLKTVLDHLLLVPILARALRKASSETAETAIQIHRDWSDAPLEIRRRHADTRMKHRALRGRTAFYNRLAEAQGLIDGYYEMMVDAQIRYKDDPVALALTQACALKALQEEMPADYAFEFNEQGQVRLVGMKQLPDGLTMTR